MGARVSLTPLVGRHRHQETLLGSELIRVLVRKRTHARPVRNLLPPQRWMIETQLIILLPVGVVGLPA